jgi:glucokinase
VLGDRIELTNTGWHWSTEALRRALGFERMVCFNDAEAQAFALPHLAAADLKPIGADAASPLPDAPRVLIAPGSGLGVSVLLTIDGRARAIAGEGGHATMAPETGPERDLAAMLAAKFGGHASWERVLSGPGIAAIYGWIEQRNGIAVSGATQEDIVRWARAGDGLAKSAVEMFLGLLGSYAGDLALIVGARGGVFFGGGIVPAIADTIAAGPLRLRFEAKGRFRDYLRAIPTAIIVHPNPGLIGAAARLASMQGNDE